MLRQREEHGIREYPLFTHHEVEGNEEKFQAFRYNRELYRHENKFCSVSPDQDLVACELPLIKLKTAFDTDHCVNRFLQDYSRLIAFTAPKA